MNETTPSACTRVGNGTPTTTAAFVGGEVALITAAVVRVSAGADEAGSGVAVWVKGMFEAANASAFPERDRALMAVLFGLALRRGEVTQLGVEDFDPSRGVFLVQGKGQGGQRVVVRAPPEVVEAVSAWVVVRGGSSGALFLRARPRLVGSSGEPEAAYRGRLSPRAIAAVVARLATVAGATVKVKPHGLRHAAITEAAKKEKDLVKLRDFARHRDIRTTAIYIDNLENHGLEIATSIAGVLSETNPNGSG